MRSPGLVMVRLWLASGRDYKHFVFFLARFLKNKGMHFFVHFGVSFSFYSGNLDSWLCIFLLIALIFGRNVKEPGTSREEVLFVGHCKLLCSSVASVPWAASLTGMFCY
jgi:hypothetical protein